MNQERAKKYINEIESWLKESEKYDSNNLETDTNKLVKCMSLFSIDNEIYSSIDVCEMSDLQTDSCKSNLQFNSDNSKKAQFIKNIQSIKNQIKVLREMLQKQYEQIKKNNYPVLFKPVQRVEPINHNLSENEQNNLRQDNKVHKTFFANNYFLILKNLLKNAHKLNFNKTKNQYIINLNSVKKIILSFNRWTQRDT